MTQLSKNLLLNKHEFDQSKHLLNSIDLLLEAHKQLTSLDTNMSEMPSSPVLPMSSAAEELERVRERIAHIEKINSAISFLSTCSIPSVASSPLFTTSLSLLVTNTALSPSLLKRSCWLMQKCWDNAITVMERVLDRDLTSIEAYLDDNVYKEMRDRVLKQLISPVTLKPTAFSDLIVHFVNNYTQLRENFVTFILDTRLNSQFADSNPRDQVLHFIERTRLLMVVETREFQEIFGGIPGAFVKAQLNKILETVGNLLLQRIDLPCKQLSLQDSKEIAAFIHPLMNSILNENDQKDPFGLFLKLITERFHFDASVNSSDIKAVSSDDNAGHNSTSVSNVINV